MPDWLAVIILGIVEGITEFLPVSSTGHLILCEKLMPTVFTSDAEREVFLITIQSGAVIAVVAALINRLRELGTTRHEPNTQDYLKKLIFAFVFTGIFGLAVEKAVERSGGQMIGDNPLPVAWALLIGGVLFILIEKKLRIRYQSSYEDNVDHRSSVWYRTTCGSDFSRRIAQWHHYSCWIIARNAPVGGSGVFFFARRANAACCGRL